MTASGPSIESHYFLIRSHFTRNLHVEGQNMQGIRTTKDKSPKELLNSDFSSYHCKQSGIRKPIQFIAVNSHEFCIIKCSKCFKEAFPLFFSQQFIDKVRIPLFFLQLSYFYGTKCVVRINKSCLASMFTLSLLFGLVFKLIYHVLAFVPPSFGFEHPKEGTRKLII